VTIVGMTPLEDVPPEDEHRALWRRPVRQRLVVLSAGSFVHFVLAVLLVALASLSIGRAVELSPGLASVFPCVPASAQATCEDAGALPGPAQAAGLAEGDTVVAVDGRPVDGVLTFITAVRESPGEPVAVTVERSGERRELSVTPVAVERPSLTVRDQVETVGAVGVQMEFRRGTERLDPVAAVGHSVDTMQQMASGMVTVFTEKLGTITQVYGPERDPEGFVGVVGAGRISGEVLASDETLGFKVLGFLLLIAGLNLFVGVFNLLPLMPLDGGHIAVALYEQARDKVRRVFGYRGELQRVDLTKLLPLTYAVMLFFAGFTLFLLGADIVNPITLN
jgi:membrane-associated protease RseP (regulator of RpoE activity)